MDGVSATNKNKQDGVYRIVPIIISIIALVISYVALVENRRIANAQLEQNERLVYLENDLGVIQKKAEYISGIYEELQSLVMDVKLGLPYSYANLDNKSLYFTDKYKERIHFFYSLTNVLLNYIDEKTDFIDEEIELNVVLLDIEAFSLSRNYDEIRYEHSKLFKSKEYYSAISDFEARLSQLQSLVYEIKTQVDTVLSGYFGLVPKQ